MNRLEQVFAEIKDVFSYYKELEATKGVGYKSRFGCLRNRLESAVLNVGRLLVEESFGMGEQHAVKELSICCSKEPDGEYLFTVPEFESVSFFHKDKDYAMSWLCHMLADVYTERLCNRNAELAAEVERWRESCRSKC